MDLKNLQSRGMTHDQIRELGLQQAHDQVKKVKANKADQLQDPYFERDFGGHEIEAHESDLYHVVMEVRAFDQQTGAKISVAHTQNFTKQMYEEIRDTRGFEGKTVEILHDPTYVAPVEEEDTKPEEDVEIQEGPEEGPKKKAPAQKKKPAAKKKK